MSNASASTSSQAISQQWKIMRKLLGQPLASTTNESSDIPTHIEPPKLRPIASQHTVYSAGSPLTCLDRSPDGHRAVIAGPRSFQILRVDGSNITEEINLRAVVSSYTPTHDAPGATTDQLNIRAVKWSHGTLDSTIVTASGNGRITIYDLNRVGEGLEVARLQEHARQVHTLAISPFRNTWVLSASQDGSVKSFDIRLPPHGQNGPTMKSSQTYKGNADSVRDVKWSPTDGFEFACCTDSGAVLKWDIRKPLAPVLKIAAHPTSCSSISWHPDGEHLISGGIDLVCYVWDVSGKADRYQKPRYSIATPAPISKVLWRPACWSATAQGKRAAQVTVAYDDSNTSRNQYASVHLWDLARPAFPFKQIEQWDSAPTGLLWNSRDILWSVDRSGKFVQTDVAFVPQLIDRRSLSDFSFSPSGDVLMLLEERQPARRPRHSMNTPEASPGFPHGSGPLLSMSRSDSEEDVVGSFLGPRQPKIYRRRNSTRSVNMMSTTPPSTTGFAEGRVMTLEEAIGVTGPYKPQQIMAIGHAPSTAKRSTYKYFSNVYLSALCKEAQVGAKSKPLNMRMTLVMESYATAAEAIRHYRLAQTWRLLGYTFNLLLIRRAEHHRQLRLKPEVEQEIAKGVKKSAKSDYKAPLDEDTPRPVHHPKSPLDSPSLRHSQYTSDERESTSNVATPLVRPVRDHTVHGSREYMHTPMLPDDDLKLPEPSHGPVPVPIPIRSSRESSSDQGSSIEGYDFYGMESLSPPIKYVAPPRKQPLRLDYLEHRENHDPRSEPRRHDSGESFQMFSTSGDSHDRFMTMTSSGSDGHSDTKEQSRSLRERVSTWENSFEDNRRHRQSFDSDAPTTSDLSEGRGTPDSDPRKYHHGKHMPRNPPSPPVFRVQRNIDEKNGTTTPIKSRPLEEPISPTFITSNSLDPNLIENDFFPWPSDPSFLISPIDPSTLLQRSIDFESQTGVLHASAMVLLLRPLLSPSSVDEIQAGAVLRQYHHRLTSMKLFTEATMLRNVCVPLYPNVFAPAQEKVTTGFRCTDCGRPNECDPLVEGSWWKCARCRGYMAPCAVCLHRELPASPPASPSSSPTSKKVPATWFICPGCGHGGHASCLATWHASSSSPSSPPEHEVEGTSNSGGCCPLEGCLHPCLPGPWREELRDEKRARREKEMEGLVRENSRRGNTGSGLGRSASGSGRGVRRDRREVGQSRAVEGVRATLVVGGNNNSGIGPPVGGLAGGVGPGGAGSGTSGGLDRKKSVKLVAPGEEGGSM